MEGKTQTSIIPKIEKDGLMDRAKNLSEIRNMNSNSNNKEGCQKEADIKGNIKAAKYSVGELPKSKNPKEDNKLKLTPHATYVPVKVSNNEEMHDLINMIQQQAAPEVELECFDGNPLECNHFLVEKWIPEPKGRLLRLLKYTRGEAHDLIKHCVQEPPYMGYSHAQQLLRKRYGDPHIILSTYIKEVRNWPKLKFGDAKGFRKFYNFLVKCEGVAKEQLWNAITIPDILCMLVSKLPNGLIDRWNRTAYNIRKRHQNGIVKGQKNPVTKDTER